VVMDDHPASGMRRVMEGAVTATVRRRLNRETELQLVPAGH
jgi:hypothetical protein